MTNEAQIRRLVVDLKRLLYRMETYNPDKLSSHTLRGRATLANEMLVQLQELEYSGSLELRDQVKDASLKAEALAIKKKETEVGVIEKIFFESNRRGGPEEDLKDLMDEVDQSLDETSASNDEDDSIPKETEENQRGGYERVHGHDEEVEEIQKAQREQLEAEISHMASQLKSSTQHMNTTLRGQTENLQDMEDLAAENINKVGKAAENVQEHNKRAWSSTIATWTWFMVAIGVFIFCMVTIKMVPRRANACLFNCKDPLKMEKSASKRVEELKAKQREIELKTKQMEGDLVKQKEKEQLPEQCESETREGEESQCNASQIDNADDSHPKNPQPSDHQGATDSKRKDKKPKQQMLLNPHRQRNRPPKQRQIMDQNVSSEKKEKKKEKEKKNKPQMLLNPHRRRDLERNKRTGQMKQQMLKNIHGRIQRNVKNLDSNEKKEKGRGKEKEMKGQELLNGIEKKEREIGFKEDKSHRMEKAEDLEQTESKIDVPKRREKSSVEPEQESANDNVITKTKADTKKEKGIESKADVENDNEETRLMKNTEQGEIDIGNADLNTGGTTNNLPSDNEPKVDDSLYINVCESGECSAANDVTAGSESMPPADKAPAFTEFDVISTAKVGNNKLLLKYLDMKPEWVNFVDENGWAAIHEAVRGQHTSTVIILLERGSNANAVTASGASPLAMALDYFGESHEITKQLRKVEAREIRPTSK